MYILVIQLLSTSCIPWQSILSHSCSCPLAYFPCEALSWYIYPFCNLSQVMVTLPATPANYPALPSHLIPLNDHCDNVKQATESLVSAGPSPISSAETSVHFPRLPFTHSLFHPNHFPKHFQLHLLHSLHHSTVCAASCIFQK